MSEEIRTSEEDENVREIDKLISDAEDTSDDINEEKEPDLEELLEVARKEAAEYLDGWQRARAEYANARKRLERDKADSYRNATLEFAKKMLPVMDDFERALGIVPDAIATDNWFEGVLLIKRKIDSVFEELNIERIETMGHEFDPNFHEALTLLQKEGVETGMIVEEVQSGYRIGDRVIRPAMVNVAA